MRSLLDTDFYKLLMLQFIWKNFPAGACDERDDEPDGAGAAGGAMSPRRCASRWSTCSGCGSSESEMMWLAGNTFYGVRQIFEPAFLDWLEQEFPAVRLRDQRSRMGSSCCGSAGCGPR